MTEETTGTPAPEANKPEPVRAVALYEPMLQFFAFEHLPPHLKPVSKVFHDLAVQIVVSLPSNPERTTCLRKLLEAKDCAVRAVIYR